LRAYAEAGFSEVQVWLEPFTLDAIAEFARVLDLLDSA
jgi:hypothetical protein